MVRALAAYHGDTASLTPEDLARDTLGAAPWLTLLVAEGAEGLVGYAALFPLAQLQFGVRGMDMHHLFVRQERRRCGVARALVAASVTFAQGRGCRFLAVGTDPDNTAAQRTYDNLGFTRAPQAGPRFRMKW
ncbi:Aminoglycoside N(6')-acetyltransferase type 1 [Sulfitobacter sp. THAF37]|nr:Aminoglycoside N(6')-acetyltransferase type 1 [Sulfitobacter sp. THAF37]